MKRRSKSWSTSATEVKTLKNWVELIRDSPLMCVTSAYRSMAVATTHLPCDETGFLQYSTDTKVTLGCNLCEARTWKSVEATDFGMGNNKLRAAKNSCRSITAQQPPSRYPIVVSASSFEGCNLVTCFISYKVVKTTPNTPVKHTLSCGLPHRYLMETEIRKSTLASA